MIFYVCSYLCFYRCLYIYIYIYILLSLCVTFDSISIIISLTSPYNALNPLFSPPHTCLLYYLTLYIPLHSTTFHKTSCPCVHLRLGVLQQVVVVVVASGAEYSTFTPSYILVTHSKATRNRNRTSYILITGDCTVGRHGFICTHTVKEAYCVWG